MKELYEFNQKMANKWQPFDRKNPPKHLQVAYERPDVWIEPCESFLVQVKAVEIHASDKYKAGYTLKFVRLEKFRPDKAWYECMTLREIEELREKNDGKLTSGKHFSLENDVDADGNILNDGEPDLKKKRIQKPSRKTIVDNIYRGIDSSCVDKMSDLFEGKEFCVMIEDDYQRKVKLEKSIAELGGDLSQNPGNF